MNTLTKSYRRSSEYNPRGSTIEILDLAMEHVNSVPYKVSLRWLFYRLLQDGIYGNKNDYKDKFEPVLSRARRAFYRGWTPDTLVDETRDSIFQGSGYLSVEDWLTRVPRCVLDKWESLPNYVEIWFEARAMSEQFKHYTKYITLRPMAGQPSITYKWEIAKDLESRSDKEITILYFGDLDYAGRTIADVVHEDTFEWSGSDFEFVWCGLTKEQVDLYDVPSNLEKPGQWQWEALTDQAAGKIIQGAVSNYLDYDLMQEIEMLENEANRFRADRDNDILDDWQEHLKN